MIFRCPTENTDDPNDPVIGCGTIFEQDGPDEEGFVDCPKCGMWFLLELWPTPLWAKIIYKIKEWTR